VKQNFSLHESYHDGESVEVGSDRSFGYTVGGILMAFGAFKGYMAAAVTPVAALTFVPGALLLLFGIVAPSRLSPLNRLWMRLGLTIAKVVNPVILALLFYVVFTPMAVLMRIASKQPLHLVPDRTAVSYWIVREPSESAASDMRRQF
jgi:hypothetical protein